ncbi:xibalbin-1-like [Tachypleus tridentatus]|uniref:xibalbin-1-like n=1 Tax=Tachypleus tridentatus TaxID=6853 RepID=UPI003FCF42EE
MNYFAVAVIFSLVMLADTIVGSSYTSNEDKQLQEYRERLQNILSDSYKRTCISRGRSCDVRPNSCCGGSSCRCNLWGTNCRCQRQGLFQGWGK